MRPGWTWPVVLATATACAREAPPAEEAGPSSADSVQMAATQFDPANFDTIQWETPEAAVERGGVVFNYSCSRCHGPEGYGNGGFVIEGDTLRPPSFHAADWRFAEDPAGLRKLIYTGAEGGMPHWGLVGLKYRDVDAVASYILEKLRAES